ncbi:MAG TPA: glycyl-radical enzyme activating protein [Synergistaceae bacterium]|jgi:pyruvate formate lyase activating enzyme|nr:glycyl-radical enzyme activating protein [Synergistaceae bacterium]
MKGSLPVSTGIIFDIKRYAIHDGPGIRTSVFLKGCPLKCWWCHNPESQSIEPVVVYRPERCIGCGACEKACPEGAIRLTQKGFIADPAFCRSLGKCAEVCPSEARELVGKRVDVAWVMEEIEKDRLFYEESGGGVTFTGGEPLVQPDFLEELLCECRNADIHTAVDTTGYAPQEVISKIARFTDLFLYDIKLMDPDKHLKYTGVSNDLILDNLVLLSKEGARISVRVPVIPGINDDAGEMDAIACFISDLPGIVELAVLPYHGAAKQKYERFGMEYLLRDLKEPLEEEMENLAGFFRSKGLKVKIGG